MNKNAEVGCWIKKDSTEHFLFEDYPEDYRKPDKKVRVVCCTHPNSEHCAGCTMSRQCDGNVQQLVRDNLAKGLKQTPERRFALCKADFGERLMIIGSNNLVEVGFYNDEQEVYKHD